MTSRLPSERVTACGQTESGKTEFLRRHFISRMPRVLIVDRTGEWFAREPSAPSAVGLHDTVRQLDDYASKARWRIIVSLSNEEILQLAKALVGIPDIRAGYSFNVSGMAVVLSEVDLLVPMANAPEELRSLWRRGSHAGLSIYADTQRPSNVSKEVTSQCNWLAFLALYEPNDVKYMRDALGTGMFTRALEWTRRRYHAVLFDNRRRVCHLVDQHGSVRDTLTDRSPGGQLTFGETQPSSEPVHE